MGSGRGTSRSPGLPLRKGVCTKPVLGLLGNRGAPVASTPPQGLLAPERQGSGSLGRGPGVAHLRPLPQSGVGIPLEWGDATCFPSISKYGPSEAVPSACLIPAAPRMGTGEGLVPSPGPRQWGCAARVSPLSYVTACGCHGHGGGGPGSRIEDQRPPGRALPSPSSSPPLGIVCQTPRSQGTDEGTDWASACPSVI